MDIKVSLHRSASRFNELEDDVWCVFRNFPRISTEQTVPFHRRPDWKINGSLSPPLLHTYTAEKGVGGNRQCAALTWRKSITSINNQEAFYRDNDWKGIRRKVTWKNRLKHYVVRMWEWRSFIQFGKKQYLTPISSAVANESCSNSRNSAKGSMMGKWNGSWRRGIMEVLTYSSFVRISGC